MTTEVQIGSNRLHLQLLRKVVSRTVSSLGMSRRAVQETEEAVNQVCLVAMGRSGNEAGAPICVKLSTGAASVTVDVTSRGDDPLEDMSGVMARIGRLVDEIALIAGEESSTIRIVKSGEKVQAVSVVSPAYLTTSLQS